MIIPVLLRPPDQMYTVLYMVRMQVYLTESQRRSLERKARANGQPVAALIRRAIDRYLGGEGGEPDPRAALARTLGALKDLEVPSRQEWDRAIEAKVAEDPAPYG